LKKRYAGFIFDQDNTLVDSERLWPSLDGVYFPALIGEENWEVWKPDWLQMRKDHVPLDTMLGLLKSRFKLKQTVAHIKAEREQAMFDLYHKHNLQPLPGARELLMFALEQGIPVAIASGMNTPIIQFVIELMGWKPYVRAIASTHEGDKRNKPHPDVCLLAANRLGVEPAQCLAVDNDWKGYQAAQVAGMNCYIVRDHWFDERRQESERESAKIGERTFGSLVEVLADLKTRLS